MVGSYRIERCIGEGGMGRVYEAVHPNIGSRVAIKVLTRDVAQNPHIVERFFEEARSVNRIRHEGIVNVLDLATLPDGRPFILMELLDGGSLAQLIASSGALSSTRVVDIGSEVLDALAAAHAEGIVHRDIKPDNIFITRSGRAKILDFGIAKLLPQGAAAATTTNTGLVGTPQYMAPEQAAGGRIDGRTDIYALGLVLYEALTGVRAFDAPSLYELLKQQVEVMPPPPRVHVPGVPEVVEAAVYRALAKLPEDRHADAASFRAALRGEVGSAKLAVVSYDQRPAAEVAYASTMVAAHDAAMPAATAPPVQAAEARTPPLATPSTLRGVADDAPAPRGSSFGWVIRAAFVVAALGLGALGLWLVPKLTKRARNATRPAATATTVDEAPPAVRAPELALEQGFDIARFDTVAYAPLARARAARLVKQPHMLVMTAQGIGASGHVDLNDKDSTVGYIFVSRDQRRCVRVRVRRHGVMVTDDRRKACPDGKPIRMPRCPLAKMVAVATHGMKLPKGLNGSFKYKSNRGEPQSTAGEPQWRVTFGSGFQRHFPDSC
jgi:hypothetical protein